MRSTVFGTHVNWDGLNASLLRLSSLDNRYVLEEETPTLTVER